MVDTSRLVRSAPSKPGRFRYEKPTLTHRTFLRPGRGRRHDDDAQVRFASRFGPLTQAHPTVASVEGKPAVLPVDSENGSANN
jgi:hypothetical protein